MKAEAVHASMCCCNSRAGAQHTVSCNDFFSLCMGSAELAGGGDGAGEGDIHVES